MWAPNKKKIGWRHLSDLKSFGRPSAKALLRLRLSKSKRQNKITLPPIRREP